MDCSSRGHPAQRGSPNWLISLAIGIGVAPVIGCHYTEEIFHNLKKG
jgi:hypothetical protein